MINKLMAGSLLVAVMGGVPGATYLLTREEGKLSETSTEEKGDAGSVETSTPASSQITNGQLASSEATCTPPVDGETCPSKAEKPPQ